MSTNPLKDRTAPATTKLTPSQWADRGNAHLASIGRNDCHWVVRDGRCVIEMKRYT